MFVKTTSLREEREAKRVLPVAQHCRICGEVLSSELPNILEMASEEKDLYSE